jgi:hypothetical protein
MNVPRILFIAAGPEAHALSAAADRATASLPCRLWFRKQPYHFIKNYTSFFTTENSRNIISAARKKVGLQTSDIRL